MTYDVQPTAAKASKSALRKLIPEFLLRERGIARRLVPGAGSIYVRLRLLDAIGMRNASRRLAPSSSRSFLFVCFGNIMRSAMAESFLRRALLDAGCEQDFRVQSAGLHATAGKPVHPWAQQASAEMGINLERHRARLLTREMIDQSDCILAMDFQNQAELLALYPESKQKLCLLSGYGEGEWRYREIIDPYHGSLESTKVCANRLQICVRNLLAAILPSVNKVKKIDSPG